MYQSLAGKEQSDGATRQ